MSTAALEVVSAIAELDPTGISPKILSLALKINEQYGQMKDNQEVCLGLKREVDLISEIVQKLCTIKQIGPCEKTLTELEGCLNQCLTLIQSIGAQKDTLQKIKAFMSAKGNQEVITKLTNQLHSISDILNLALTAQAANSIEEVRDLVKQKEMGILPTIQQTNTEINEDVTRLVQQITQITVAATNAQVGDGNQQTNNAGGAGGSANANTNIYLQAQPSPSSSERRGSLSLETEIKHMAQEKDKHVLESLKQLFRDGRGEEPGKQTNAYDIYNDILKKHNAALAYKKGKDIHVLYVNDNPIRGEKETLAEISKMIISLSHLPTAKAQNTSAAEVVNKRRGSDTINLTDKKTDNEKSHHVLEELKAFFLEERDEGEKTENYAIYNEYLKKVHGNARLVYQQSKNKHVLYVNDEALNTEKAFKELSKIIQSLPSLTIVTQANQEEMAQKTHLSNPPPYVASDAHIEVARKRRESNLINLADTKTDNEKSHHVLEELRAFFLEERDVGAKTENYAIYNEYLKNVHKNARIVYKPTQNKHVLYVNDALLDADNAAKEISKMLQSLATANTPQKPLPPPPEVNAQSVNIPQAVLPVSPVKANPPAQKNSESAILTQFETAKPALGSVNNSKATNLIEAIKQNNQTEVSRLLALKTDHCGKRFIDEVDSGRNEGPLYWAVHSGYTHFIDPLLQAGANVNTKNRNGKTMVYVAAERGHVSAIAALHAAGANVNAPDKDGTTPVFIAAQNGHASAIAALHVAGANVNTPWSGITPVYVAAENGHAPAIAALHAAGANVNTSDKDGTTPVFIAAQNGHASAIATLHAAGANVNAPDNDDQTPVYVAAKNGHAETITALKAAGANVNTPNNDGWTPTYIAARNGNASAIAALKASGANVDKSVDGFTPIYVAAERGHAEAIIALKRAGANVNKKNNDGFTPIYIAAENAQVEAITALLESGANASIKTSEGTALETAKRGKKIGHKEVVNILKAHLKSYPDGIKEIEDIEIRATLEGKNPPVLVQYSSSKLTAAINQTSQGLKLKKG